MASILNVRDVNNNVVHIPAIRGEKGDPTDLTVVPSKDSVVDGDGFLIADSADSKSSKLLLWSTIKAIFASRIVPAAAGNLATLDANGNLADSGKKTTDFDDSGAASGAVSTHNAAGDAHTALFAAKQSTITASGLLKGAGDGTVSAAARGTDYSLVNAPVIVSVPYTGWVKNATTNAYEQSVAVAGLLATDDKRTRVEIVGSTDVAAQALIDTAAGLLSYVACNANGQLYMRCDSGAPATTFSVVVVIVR